MAPTRIVPEHALPGTTHHPLTHFDQSLKNRMKYPERILKALQRAEANLQRGSPADSLADLELATTRCPKGFHPWSLLGRARSMLGDQAAAEAAYRNALKILPTDPATWFNLGITFSARDMFAEAVPCYVKALNYGSMSYDPQAAQNLGSCYLKLGRFGEARDVFLDLLQFGNNGNTQALLGLALHGMEDFKAAAQALERALELGIAPNHKLFKTLGDCYGSLGEKAKADECRMRAEALEARAEAKE